MSSTNVGGVSAAVGILRDDAGRVLLCQRPSGGRYPCKWEFPGGKIEGAESPAEALVRELREELGIEAREFTPYHTEEVLYADGGRFTVTFFRVTRWDGVAINRSFAAVAWVSPDDLGGMDVLQGSIEVCRKLAAGLRPSGDGATGSA